VIGRFAPQPWSDQFSPSKPKKWLSAGQNVPRLQQGSLSRVTWSYGIYNGTSLDCQRLEPAADLSGAMAAAIEHLSGEGWNAESTPE
jgi:hypothetical protein